ncbi:MAG: DUF896 domain-containing protein [Oscillospiraceae bacterium]|nr:DUF896 domain-containing protein [Oscillospiraceae bacterium]MBQ9208311.1 DUF896 domain-containing protein [Oscillospiraceae bacterium]
MTKEKIARINELFHKSKTQGLTEEEKAEQTALRNEYRRSFVANLSQQLSTIQYTDAPSLNNTPKIDIVE